MVVRVLNYQYTPELKNKTSPVYKSLEKNFTDEVRKGSYFSKWLSIYFIPDVPSP